MLPPPPLQPRHDRRPRYLIDTYRRGERKYLVYGVWTHRVWLYTKDRAKATSCDDERACALAAVLNADIAPGFRSLKLA